MPGKHKRILMKCSDCGFERLVEKRKGMVGTIRRCHSCTMKSMTGSKAGAWKGGRIKHTEGYIEIRLTIDDFFFSMTDSKGYISEHRLVMAKYLKRCLLPWEIVHHKNGIRDDNRLENLELLPGRKYHIGDTLTKSLLKTMTKRIQYLENLLKMNGISFGKGGHRTEKPPAIRPDGLDND